MSDMPYLCGPSSRGARLLPKFRKIPSAVTMRDVAARAGVSVMTASNVLTGKGRMKPETRDAVTRAMTELRYVPNMAARALASAADLRVALLYPDVDSYFLSQLVLGALNGAAVSGAHLVVEKYSADVPEAAIRLIRELIASGCGAILLTSPLSEMIARMTGERPDVPLATIAGGSDLNGMLSIRVDNVAAGRAVADHLLDLGHREIGFIAGPPGHSASHDRLAGFRASLDARGVALPDRLIRPGNFDFPSGWVAADQLLSDPTPPTAIFATSDDMAAAVIANALHRGINLPSSLSVVGFDDTPLATRIWPFITTVRQPVVEMAERAVRWLVNQMRNGCDRTDTVVELPFELVRRHTTTGPRASTK